MNDGGVPYVEVRCGDCGWQWIAEVQLISARQEAHDLRKALEFSLRLGLSFVNIRGTDVWYVYGGQPGPLHEMPAELHGVLEAARIAIRSTVDGEVKP